MLSVDEQRTLDMIADGLDRDDPDLASQLSPGRQSLARWTWRSWLLVYLLVLPWAVLVFLVDPVTAAVLVAAPVAVGAVVRTVRTARAGRGAAA